MNPFLLWSLPRLSLNRNDRPRTEPEVRRIKKDNRDEGGSNLIPTGDSIAQRHTYFSLSQSSSPSSLTTRIKRMHDNVIRAPCIFKIPWIWLPGPSPPPDGSSAQLTGGGGTLRGGIWSQWWWRWRWVNCWFKLRRRCETGDSQRTEAKFWTKQPSITTESPWFQRDSKGFQRVWHIAGSIPTVPSAQVLMGGGDQPNP